MNFGRLCQGTFHLTDELVYWLEGGGAEVAGSGLVGGVGRLASGGHRRPKIHVIEDPPTTSDSAPYALVGSDGVARSALEVLENGHVVVEFFPLRSFRCN